MNDLFGQKVTSDDMFDIDFSAARIYDKYPRKVARKAAIKAIIKAIKYESKSNNVDLHDASLQILHATEMFAKSPDVLEKLQMDKRQFICIPTSWYNQGRYTDSNEENGYKEKTKEQNDIRQDLIDLGLIKD
tara:strand:- start:204 stop:599 length:396 start_codon:yes stop_codon:yes gene_type:complete